jgi:hypothetical protein
MKFKANDITGEGQLILKQRCLKAIFRLAVEQNLNPSINQYNRLNNWLDGN